MTQARTQHRRRKLQRAFSPVCCLLSKDLINSLELIIRASTPTVSEKDTHVLSIELGNLAASCVEIAALILFLGHCWCQVASCCRAQMSLFVLSGIRSWEAAVLTSMVIHKPTDGSPLAMLPDSKFCFLSSDKIWLATFTALSKVIWQ